MTGGARGSRRRCREGSRPAGLTALSAIPSCRIRSGEINFGWTVGDLACTPGRSHLSPAFSMPNPEGRNDDVVPALLIWLPDVASRAPVMGWH
jgi:hypothetical protein